jgi:uncharacterized protein (TIGR02284 family)
MNENEEILPILERLLEVARISHKGYKDAAEHVENPSLQMYFMQFAQQRAQYADELSTLILNAGGSPADAESFSGTMMRAWIDFKSGFIGSNTNEIIDQCLKEEQTTLIEFEKAQKEDLPENIKAVVDEKNHEIKKVYDTLHTLKEEYRE